MRRAEKRSSKPVLLESPFLLCPLKVFKCFSGPEKGVITKGVSSPEKSLESLKSLNSLESLGNGRNLLSFPQSGGSLETLESRISKFSRISRKWTFLKRPLFRTRALGANL